MATVTAPKPTRKSATSPADSRPLDIPGLPTYRTVVEIMLGKNGTTEELQALVTRAYQGRMGFELRSGADEATAGQEAYRKAAETLVRAIGGKPAKTAPKSAPDATPKPLEAQDRHLRGRS